MDARSIESGQAAQEERRRQLHGLLPHDEYPAYASAMIRIALDKNEAARAHWIDIRLAWDKPGCETLGRAVGEWLIDGNQAQDVPGLIDGAHAEWNHPDVITLLEKVDAFILKAFNGPTDPILRRTLGATEYKRAPKYKERVTAANAPMLKRAVLLQSWTEHKHIDIEELDRETRGDDYDLVTSGAKPTTEQARARKAEINDEVRAAKLHFDSERKVDHKCAMWYQARVIRGSVRDAASDFAVNNDSTFERMIVTCDRIAGLT